MIRPAAGRLVAVALLSAALLLPAAPAAADPAGPTHYRSTVTGIDGLDEPVVDVEVIGGDAFVVVHVEPGTSVEVPGYDGEPYIRIDADGSVLVNQRSPARWLNEERYGVPAGEVPTLADAEAAPDFRHVADGGVYAWHDHRVHVMAPTTPDHVDTSARRPQPVWDWSIPLLVDGRPVDVHGELVWLPGPRPVVPVLVMLLVAATALTILWRRPASTIWAVAVGALVTFAAGLSANVGQPPGADGDPALVVLPAVAVVLAGAGLGLTRTGRTAGSHLVPAAGVPLLVWGIVLWGALTRPVVPGLAPGWAIRAAVAVALGIGVACVGSLARRLAAPSGPAPVPADAG